MEAIVLIEPGRGRLAEFPRRSGVLVGVVSVHVLLACLLASNGTDRQLRSGAVTLEAEIIPLERPLPPPPPPLAPPTVQAVAPLEILPPEVSFETPTERVTEIQPIQTEPLHHALLPVTAGTPRAVEPRPDVEPRPISGPLAIYPVASVKAKESGKVLTEICVSPVGTVDTVQVARSSGFPRLDRVAVHVASQYRFRPATRDGNPVHACVRYNIIFKLN